MQLSIKYRPSKFSDVIGQRVAVGILINSIKMDRVPAALLLSGVYGCGKTTLARLYAKALNCENLSEAGEPCQTCEACLAFNKDAALSIKEVDAASHSGVEDVRAFEDLLKFNIPGKYRVVILDECHMLSKAAQAALLKLLEEPRKNTLFILVTTDPQKLEVTVKSRCLNLTLQPVSYEGLRNSIVRLLEAEGRQADDGFISQLARAGNGSLRDTQQLLEGLLLSTEGLLTEDCLRETLSLVSSEVYKDLAYALNVKSYLVWHETIEAWVKSGIDLALVFREGVPRLLRDFSVCAIGAGSSAQLSYSGISQTKLSANLVLTFEEIRYILRRWEVYMDLMRDTSYAKIVWDMFAVSLCSNEDAE